jgi:hypothetical protein
MVKTLIVYCGHEINENLIFFARNGYIDDPQYDFVFVMNNPDLCLEFRPKKQNVTYIARENTGFDFGGWSHALFMKSTDMLLYEKYDYFIFLNSTVRGPFLPVYIGQDVKWPELFIRQLDEKVKITGSALAWYKRRPFISSAFFATDKIGLKIGIDNGIFSPETIMMSKADTVIKKEMGFTNVIMDAGYTIKCMLKYYENMNFKVQRCPYQSICHLNPNHYFGTNVNPYEVIFIKQNRNIEPLRLERYTEWHSKKIGYNIKALCGTGDNNKDMSNIVRMMLEKDKYIHLNVNSSIDKVYLFIDDDALIVNTDVNVIILGSSNDHH